MQIELIVQWFSGMDFDFVRFGTHRCQHCDTFCFILLGIGLILDFENHGE